MSPIRCPSPKSRHALALAAVLLVPAGASAAGKLAFAPASLDFGANALGEIKTLTATLKNGTAADIALNAATLADNPGGYALASTTCGATLAAGQSCEYTLRYTAKSLQPAAARLELTTLDPVFPLLKLPLQANRYPALNDTGITRCGNANQNGLTCPVPNFPEQDAQFGRDKKTPAASNGKAGFNYTKLDSKGKALPASAQSWNCVRDNVTGLIWERKPLGDGTRGNQGLHDADDIYTWFSTDAGNNGGDEGFPSPGWGNCFGYVNGQPASYCNTEAYVNRVNAAGWCGYTDWRLPDRFELSGLVDLSISYPGPTIDTNYFPDTRWTVYWSSSPFAEYPFYIEDPNEEYPIESVSVWYVGFASGESFDNGNNGTWDGAVRLVRGGQ